MRIGRAFFGLTAPLLAGAYLGVLLTHALDDPASTAHRIVTKITRGFGALALRDRPATRVVTSNRLSLSLTEYFLPLELKTGGGGLAADGTGALLLLDLEGRVFRFSDGETRRLDVVTPDANLDDLRRRLNEGALGDVGIIFGNVRFNDLLVHEVGNRSYLLVTYTEWHDERQCYTSTLAAAAVSSRDVVDWTIGQGEWRTVTRSAPCLSPHASGDAIRGAEAGGGLVSAPDGTVLWTVGAYGRDDDLNRTEPASSVAQSDAGDYGKVLRVDIETGEVTHLAKGLRNPQGVDLQVDGTVLVTDHGMRGGDELNAVAAGRNFGFPFVTLGTRYTGRPGGLKPSHAGHGGYDRPLVAFVPSIAPSSVLVVRDFHPVWDGDVLIGGLNRKLYRVHMEDGRVLFVEPIELGLRIRDLAWIGDGRLALFTDDRKLALAAPDATPSAYDELRILIDEDPDADLRADVHQALASCLTCHSLDDGEHGTGPSLHRVCRRTPGSAGFAGYSGALDRVAGVWNEERLARFIADPEAAAPGTTMATGSLTTVRVAERLAAALCDLGADSRE